MTDVTFKTYAEAAAYAKQCARQLGVSVKLGRRVDAWVVSLESGEPIDCNASDNSHSEQTSSPNSNTDHRSDWAREFIEQDLRSMEIEQSIGMNRKLTEIKRKELAAKDYEAATKRRQERRPYLEQREGYYRSLSIHQLDELWNNRSDYNFEPDETALLRHIVREVKGINRANGNVARVCQRCRMVGDNCTCGRPWF